MSRFNKERTEEEEEWTGEIDGRWGGEEKGERKLSLLCKTNKKFNLKKERSFICKNIDELRGHCAERQMWDLLHICHLKQSDHRTGEENGGSQGLKDRETVSQPSRCHLRECLRLANSE